MGMPKKLFLFDLYINGQTYLGQVEELTPPKLSLKTEDYQGGGMFGSVAVLMGLDAGALDMDVTFGGLVEGVIKMYGKGIDGAQLRYAGSYYDDSTQQTVACEIQTRGRITEMDWGSSKQGDNTQHKYPVKNTYYKLTINNETLIEIDLINLKWVVDGVDLLEEHRANIGH
ncbi:phage major tail tube protein [Providencia manganoxydans]|uniref:phage major tail tube protein n=1 Tax=Providencia manganoxydans TaxID=2923283 RepID=UPI0034E4437E